MLNLIKIYWLRIMIYLILKTSIKTIGIVLVNLNLCNKLWLWQKAEVY